jgi:branched-chain amino acid transport system permease protein
MHSLIPAPEVIIDQIINGLTIGGIYALIALGYTLVYGILLMINFAHGEIFMFGSFAGYFVISRFVQSGFAGRHIILSLVITFVAGIVVSSVLGMLVERIAYRPLRKAPRLSPLICAIGVSIFLQNIMMIFVKARTQLYPDVFPEGTVDIGSVSISYFQIFIIVGSIIMMAGLYVFVKKSKIGKAMRAVAEDKDTAALMGVNVDRIIVTTFAVGSGLAAVAGVMVGMYYTQINHMMGFVPGIKAFTAAVLGGVGNVPGAMMGGYVLGIAEALGVFVLPAQYKDVIAFSLLVLILIFRPRGILGEVVAERA